MGGGSEVGLWGIKGWRVRDESVGGGLELSLGGGSEVRLWG